MLLRVEYRLTQLGRSPEPVLVAMHEWRYSKAPRSVIPRTRAETSASELN